MKDYLKIVVTGEVDSGKSTLIGRFLYETGSLSEGVVEEIGNVCQRLGSDFEFAYLLDSFQEERINRLTIDTTQTFCKTKRGKRLIFIDVPGHRELFQNMLCGSSYADAAILVIDAEKSIEEQTRRHLFILKFLGIDQIFLALNKMDLVGFEESVFEIIKQKINMFSEKLGIQPGFFVPLSAKQGENIIRKSRKMAWYKGLSLAEALNGYFKKRTNEDFRFPIQDIYELNGDKVAVGEIISGSIKNGEIVNILPIDKECSVRKIKVFNKNKSYAKALESIGLVLDDMNELRRGQVICKPILPKVTKEILARIFCVNCLNAKQNLRLRCVTQDVPARIQQITGVWDTATLEPKSNSDSLGQLDVAEVIMTTDIPLVLESYKGSNSLGRFILKDNSEISAVGVSIQCFKIIEND